MLLTPGDKQLCFQGNHTAQSRPLKGRVSQDAAALQPSRAAVCTAEPSALLQPAEGPWASHLTWPGILCRPLILGEVGRWLRYLAIHLPPPCPSWTLNDLGIVPLLLWAWLPHQHSESIGQRVSNDTPPPEFYDFLLRPLPSPDTSRHPGPKCEENGRPREAILPVPLPLPNSSSRAISIATDASPSLGSEWGIQEADCVFISSFKQEQRWELNVRL